MSELQRDIEALEEQIKYTEEAIDQRKMLTKLFATEAFRKLITEKFMKEETARYVFLSTDMGLTEEDRADALGFAQSAGYLQRWLRNIDTVGSMAENQLADQKATLAELRFELASNKSE